jgi:Holliday junction resolvasome RuvABC ATP-dependent DNA helicase subunit
MDRYGDYEIREILARYFCGIGVECGPKEITAIGQRSLGVPRIALGLAEMVRDEVYASHPKDLCVCRRDVMHTFDLEGIDDAGLTKEHRLYLMKLQQAHGEPRGIKTIAASLGTHVDVVEDSIEPILLALGMVDATRVGRKLTPAGHLHLANQGLV